MIITIIIIVNNYTEFGITKHFKSLTELEFDFSQAVSIHMGMTCN